MGMDEAASLPPGTEVRFNDNPQRCGVVLQVPAFVRNGHRYVHVMFPDGREPVRVSDLEHVPAQPESPLDLLRDGRFEGVDALQRALTHVRLTGKLSDVIYSMEATNTDFYAHQFKPVLKMLDSPVNGLLIADEVGLGKTIEAGLIWTELRSRVDASRLMVLCPAALREKWQAELSHRFGVHARIVNASEACDALGEAAVGRRDFALIGSLQGLRPTRGWRENDEPGPRERLAQLLEQRAEGEPLIDLLVIDEAHHLRNAETISFQLGSLFKRVSGHVVLLTATPIHNDNDDLLTLLNLLDSGLFRSKTDFAEVLAANGPLVRAREALLRPGAARQTARGYVDEALCYPLLTGNRQLGMILDALMASDEPLQESERSHLAFQLDRANLLSHVVTRTRKRDVQELRVVRRPRAVFANMTDAERAFYDRVTESVQRYCLGRNLNEKFALVNPQRMVASSLPAALSSWRSRDGAAENLDAIAYDADDADLLDALGPLTEHLVDTVARGVDLDALIRNDTKYRCLRETLTGLWREHPSAKVILFSTFRATLRYLHNRLSEDGIETQLLWGGMDRAKDQVIQEFRSDSRLKVLLSSEVGGEGVDLQFCWFLVNYDLPWNPMRIEQRIGRVDRLGQESPFVSIVNLFYGDTIDARIYDRLHQKLKICEHALGDFEALIGEQFQDLGLELLTSQLTREEQDQRIEQTRQAIANRQRTEEDLEREAHSLVAYGDYVIDKIQAAKTFQRWITPTDLLLYTREYLNLLEPGYALREVADGRFELSLPAEAQYRLGEFLKARPEGRRTRLVSQPTTEVIFNNHVTSSTAGSAEVISQLHPLVRYAGVRMRELVAGVRPMVAIDLSGASGHGFAPGLYVFAASRWSVKGVQTIERLVFAACSADRPAAMAADDAERLVNSCAATGRHWFDAAGTVDCERMASLGKECFDQLEAAWRDFLLEVDAQNQDRADVAERSMERHRQAQAARYEERIEKLRMLGNKGLVKATEVLRDRTLTGIDRRRAEVQGQRQMEKHYEEFMVGIVRIGG